MAHSDLVDVLVSCCHSIPISLARHAPPFPYTNSTGNGLFRCGRLDEHMYELYSLAHAYHIMNFWDCIDPTMMQEMGSDGVRAQKLIRYDCARLLLVGGD